MHGPLETVEVSLGDRSYRIQIGISLWDYLADEVESQFKPKRVVVLSDSIVSRLYEGALSEAFEGRRWGSTFHHMPAGERYKNLATVQSFYSKILDSGCDRKTPVVALGGGVVGDTGGFVAATLLRGLPYIQVPTTLLAMVDSSVGGKTGVDMPQGKNLVGAFYQPSLVVISVDTLKTLPPREFRAGVAEVIKYGVIYDPYLFSRLESEINLLLQGVEETRIQVIRRCCEIKADVVSKDEKESGLREVLNFGHTVGHAIETATGYGELLHGEAVSVGMVIETAIAENRGTVPKEVRPRLTDLLRRTGLPVIPPECDLERLWNLMQSDKKARGADVRMALPTSVGTVETVGGITRAEFESAWLECISART